MEMPNDLVPAPVTPSDLQPAPSRGSGASETPSDLIPASKTATSPPIVARPPIATINPPHHFEAGSTDPESEALTNQINEHLQLRAKQMGRPLTVPEQGALAHGVIDAHQHNIRAPEQSFDSINKQVAEGNSNLDNFVGGMRQGTERFGARAISTMMGSAGQNLGDEAMRSAADDPVQPGRAATAGNLVAPAVLNSPVMALEGPGHLARLIPEVLAGQGVVEGVGGARLAAKEAERTGHPIPVNQQIKQALGGAIVGGATGYAGGEVPAEIGVMGGRGLLPAAGRTVANIAAGYGMGAAGQAGSNIVNERPVGEGVKDAALGGAIQGGAFGLLHEAATRGGGASPTGTGEGEPVGPGGDGNEAQSAPQSSTSKAEKKSGFVPPETRADSLPNPDTIVQSPSDLRPAQRLRHKTDSELMARETDRVQASLSPPNALDRTTEAQAGQAVSDIRMRPVQTELSLGQEGTQLRSAVAQTTGIASDLRPVSRASEQGNAPTLAGQPKTIYHGTDQQFSDFDTSKTSDGTVWFTDNKDKIGSGESGASGRGKIIERQIDEGKLKLGGWDENDKYSTDQLISMGYDGLKLPDNGETTYQIFHPEKLSAGQPETAPSPVVPGEANDESPSRLTSTKHAFTRSDRESLGIDMPDSPERRTREMAAQQAVAQGIPDKATDLSSEIVANPRPITDVEDAGLRLKLAQLKTDHRVLQNAVNDATDPADKMTLEAQRLRVQQDFDLVTKATDLGGTESGRALGARRNVINEDMELLPIINRAQAAKGSALSPVERAKFEDLTQQLEDRNTKIDELQKQMNDQVAERVMRKNRMKYSSMTPEAKDAELSGLHEKLRGLLKAGCA